MKGSSGHAAPFVVFALPRSRTFWLSRFLSYGDWFCGHDQIRHCRSLDDVASWLAQPNTGTVETAAAPFWRLLQADRPDARVVVVRRPADAVADSLARLGFDHASMLRIMRLMDIKLDQIQHRWPAAMSVRFADLADEATCAAVFEHCLPFKHDRAWWAALAPLNMQCDMRAMVRYAGAYGPQTERVRRIAEHRSLALLHGRQPILPAGVTIAEETVEAYIADAASLRDDHYVAVGESPDYHRALNYPIMRRLEAMGALQTMIARSNGRVFGYLLTIISPSLDDASITSSLHTTFFASPLLPGLGMKLMRAANAALRAKGVGEIIFRAGTRGDGPRLGAMYRRLGAEDCGQIYRLN